MKTPREKYNNDSQYHALVDTLRSYISACKFTPSELREMVILACILYEESRMDQFSIKENDKIGKTLDLLGLYIDKAK